MTDAPAMIDFDLEYESKFWLPVPLGFAPDGPGVREWAADLIRDHTVASPFDVPPLNAILPQLLVEQWEDLDPDTSAVLWFCPWGLPPAGYVSIRVGERPEGEFSLDEYFSETTSDIEIFPQAISTVALGDGIAFSRTVTPVDPHADPDLAGDAAQAFDPNQPSYGEIVYAFTPGRALVIITCVSGESSVLGTMAPDVWDMMESMVVRS